MAFIRLYQESDRDAVIHIFRETAAPDLIAAGDPTLHYASFLWCRPYFMLLPDSCFVVDDGNGRAVGYLLGCPNTTSFVQKYKEEYIQHLQAQGFKDIEAQEPTEGKENLPDRLRQIMFHPEGMLHTKYPQMLQNWPAHLHIDLLDSHQRQGWGRQLMNRFCALAKEQGAKGIHLGMAIGNDEAAKFYARVGFSRFPVVLDDGVSGAKGRDAGAIWLVKTL